MQETTPTVMTADQARLVKAYDGDLTLLTVEDLDDKLHLTSAATRLLLDGWAIRDEASK